MSKETLRKPGKLARTAALAAGLVATGNACVNPPQVADNQIVCVPEGSQSFTFENGQGINDAVHAIEGSGQGPGDPCWSESVEKVQEALAGQQPDAGVIITIPEIENGLKP